MLHKRTLLFIIFISIAFSAVGQRNCATEELHKLGKTEDQILKEKQAFENWLIEKRASIIQQNALQETGEVTTYQIPVVVHVIHNGESYGEGFNIPDEQIHSQIEVLNRDYRRLNPDSINTPSYFKHLAADIGFEFVLAKRDPNGLPTNGITRTNGGRDLWYITDNTVLKSLNYWSSTDYFNIWIAPLGGYYGYAEYPTSDIIDGVNSEAVDNPLTDGVVIDPRAFGSVDFYPAGEYFNKFDLGRITTHEVGHFFGLRHIWGDGGCDKDDFVEDTPKTSQSYISFSNCPDPDTQLYSCNTEYTMFMNYMEYVNDACMNMFSLGQKERMVIVINNSPRRASLLESEALIEPPAVDAAITSITNPGFGLCDNNVTPSVAVINAGTTQITELEIELLVNGTLKVSHTFSLSLNAEEEAILDLPGFIQNEYGDLTFQASIVSTNGIQDDIPENNTFSKQVFYSEPTSVLNENFGSWPKNWAVRTEAPISNWNSSQAPNLIIDNTAAVLNYYEKTSSAADYLLSPTLDLTTYTNPYFIFDYSYGFREGYEDKLAVVASLDCGNTFTDTLFYKSGVELSSTELPVSFTPSGPVDWQTFVADLSDYQGQEIQIAFIGKSESGNNIYLDNIMLEETGYYDLGIKGMVNESGAYFNDVESIGVIIENKGTTVINSISIDYSEDDIKLGTIIESNLNLAPGKQQIIHVDNGFADGVHSLKFSSTEIDNNPDNNSLSVTSNFLSSVEPLPFRERFNDDLWLSSGKWTISSPNDDTSWVHNNSNIIYQSSISGNKGLHDWVVLPILDFSETNEASLEFNVAYSNNSFKNEVLRIWASTNKGGHYDYLLKTISGNSLVSNNNGNLEPESDTEWRTIFVNLNELIGEENVIIGFESVDGDGADIYLDDIELFVSDEQVFAKVEDNVAVYPNPVTDYNASVTFNLNEKQDVKIRLLDMTGKVISEHNFTDVLNQTLPLEIITNRNGIYILQTIGNNFTNSKRIMVSK
ncbi:MAG: choice-of-anchor J domain-containing protein [Bacteroidota bacterium]